MWSLKQQLVVKMILSLVSKANHEVTMIFMSSADLAKIDLDHRHRGVMFMATG